MAQLLPYMNSIKSKMDDSKGSFIVVIPIKPTLSSPAAYRYFDGNNHAYELTENPLKATRYQYGNAMNIVHSIKSKRYTDRKYDWVGVQYDSIMVAKLPDSIELKVIDENSQEHKSWMVKKILEKLTPDEAKLINELVELKIQQP